MSGATDHAPHPPKLGGVVPFSSCDYPGKLSCVVFISGCPWRCHYCHNPHLQTRSKTPTEPSWDDTLTWLAGRKGLLDAVVFCGGEPLAERWLPSMMAQVKAMGFAVALHTGGAYPARLKQCLPYLDWIGFDVKAPFAEYEQITQIRNSGDGARESLGLIRDSGIAFECRTTIHPALLDDDVLLRLATELAAYNVKDFFLQPFRPDGCTASVLLQQQLPANYPQDSTLQQLRALIPGTQIRGY